MALEGSSSAWEELHQYLQLEVLESGSFSENELARMALTGRIFRQAFHERLAKEESKLIDAAHSLFGELLLKAIVLRLSCSPQVAQEALPGCPSEAGPPAIFDLSGGVWPGDDALLATPSVVVSSGATPCSQTSLEPTTGAASAPITEARPPSVPAGGSNPASSSSQIVFWSCSCFSGRGRHRVVLTVQSIDSWSRHGSVVAQIEKSMYSGELRVCIEGPPWDGFFGLVILMCRSVGNESRGLVPRVPAGPPGGPAGEHPPEDTTSGSPEKASAFALSASTQAGTSPSKAPAAASPVGEKVLEVSVKGYFGCTGVQSWYPGFKAVVDASREHQWRCMSTLMLSIGRFFRGWRVAGLQDVREYVFSPA
eukprot:jgi/Botrbrau1/5952/Bobra.0366s0122.1